MFIVSSGESQRFRLRVVVGLPDVGGSFLQPGSSKSVKSGRCYNFYSIVEFFNFEKCCADGDEERSWFIGSHFPGSCAVFVTSLGDCFLLQPGQVLASAGP